MHAQLCPYPIITAELETGIWASEVSWGILNSDGNQVSGPFTDFTNNTLYTEELCMEPGCYTVWMEDSYGDGWQGGSISFYDEYGSLLNSGSVNEFETFLDLFTIKDCNTINCDEGQNQLNVFLSPDQYGEELVWGILNEDGGVMLGPFSEYESGIAY